MKAWLLTAVLAVALIGGAAVAVVSDDGGTSDGTVAVGVADAGDVLVALTPDAITAQHELVQRLPVDRSSEVPVFATGVARALGNLNELVEHNDPSRWQSTHIGKPDADSYRTRVAQGLPDRSHPLLC